MYFFSQKLSPFIGKSDTNYLIISVLMSYNWRLRKKTIKFFALSTPRRDQGVIGQPVSIMVEGVQVTLPSYEEAVSGGGSSASALSSESRVQIVLSEGQHSTAPEAGPSRPSNLKQQQSEMAVVHPVPPSSSSSSPSSSTWALEHAGAAAGATSSNRRPSAGSDQHSLSLDSEMDYSDGRATFMHTSTYTNPYFVNNTGFVVHRYAITEGSLKRFLFLFLTLRQPALPLTCTGEQEVEKPSSRGCE